MIMSIYSSKYCLTLLSFSIFLSLLTSSSLLSWSLLQTFNSLVRSAFLELRHLKIKQEGEVYLILSYQHWSCFTIIGPTLHKTEVGNYRRKKSKILLLLVDIVVVILVYFFLGRRRDSPQWCTLSVNEGMNLHFRNVHKDYNFHI